MKKMHIFNPYGVLPNEGWRKYRTNILAEFFANHGYNVTYWISNIDHRSKKRRADKDMDIVVNPSLTFKIVKSPEYNENGSLKRIIFEIGFSKRVKNIFISENYDADVIILSDPALFYGQYLYGIIKKKKSKLIIDILDLWPEVFITLFPGKLKWSTAFFLKPLYFLRKRLFKKADGFIAVTQDYLDVAKKINKNIPGKVVYIGIESSSLQNRKKMHLEKKEDEKWIIYAGALGINYDIKTILEFAKKLEKSHENAKLIIAGDGPLKKLVEDTITNENMHKTIFFGRLDIEQLNELYSHCDIALSTYLATSTVSLPVKAFDYIAFGLPVINSLDREYGKLIEDKKIGLKYEAENAESLFLQFLKMVSDEELLSKFTKNALNLSKEFEIEKQYKNYLNFVNKINLD